MRRDEILGLRWSDVDLDRSVLCVTRSLVSVGYELHRQTTQRTLTPYGPRKHKKPEP